MDGDANKTGDVALPACVESLLGDAHAMGEHYRVACIRVNLSPTKPGYAMTHIRSCNRPL
jgi:hypothetical protein